MYPEEKEDTSSGSLPRYGRPSGSCTKRCKPFFGGASNCIVVFNFELWSQHCDHPFSSPCVCCRPTGWSEESFFPRAVSLVPRRPCDTAWAASTIYSQKHRSGGGRGRCLWPTRLWPSGIVVFRCFYFDNLRPGKPQDTNKKTHLFHSFAMRGAGTILRPMTMAPDHAKGGGGHGRATRGVQKCRRAIRGPGKLAACFTNWGVSLKGQDT